MINKYNLSKPEKYFLRDGTEKTAWQNVGTMTEFIKEDGSKNMIVEIPAIGLKANVFPFKEKETIKQPQEKKQDEIQNETVIDPVDGRELSLDQIPF